MSGTNPSSLQALPDTILTTIYKNLHFNIERQGLEKN